MRCPMRCLMLALLSLVCWALAVAAKPTATVGPEVHAIYSLCYLKEQADGSIGITGGVQGKGYNEGVYFVKYTAVIGKDLSSALMSYEIPFSATSEPWHWGFAYDGSTMQEQFLGATLPRSDLFAAALKRHGGCWFRATLYEIQVVNGIPTDVPVATDFFFRELQ